MNVTENTTVEVQNPCLLGGARITYPEDEIFSSVCVRADTSSEVFGYGYTRPRRSSSSDEPVNYTFIGTADPDQCNATIYELFDLTRCSDPTACIDSTYFWPPVNDSGMYLVSIVIPALIYDIMLFICVSTCFLCRECQHTTLTLTSSIFPALC